MTKNELIAQFKKDYPTLTKGVNDEVITLDAEEYEATIAEWADRILAEEANIAEIENAKIAAEAKLAAIGLTTADLKALGL
jgi:hypothetical protein